MFPEFTPGLGNFYKGAAYIGKDGQGANGRRDCWAFRYGIAGAYRIDAESRRNAVKQKV